ncbi:hypothetical protein M413DRAFT_445139 [Hebeloma cylindrosporum]|uniref:Uncharacterized protein n=1 Tax=Hebeloma cylindrosporum TaxID=76867 RepID=A0A0C2XW91_HEBCY|nr:hypothetical protein M413DRAFT_445139 [Hebeloma cylindrosporum h7]
MMVHASENIREHNPSPSPKSESKIKMNESYLKSKRVNDMEACDICDSEGGRRH